MLRRTVSVTAIARMPHEGVAHVAWALRLRASRRHRRREERRGPSGTSWVFCCRCSRDPARRRIPYYTVATDSPYQRRRRNPSGFVGLWASPHPRACGGGARAIPVVPVEWAELPGAPAPSRAPQSRRVLARRDCCCCCRWVVSCRSRRPVVVICRKCCGWSL